MVLIIYIILYDINHIFFNIEKKGSRINININDLKKILFDDENVSNYSNINDIKPIIGNRTTINKNKYIKQKRVLLHNLKVKTICNAHNKNKEDSLFSNLNVKKEDNDGIHVFKDNCR